MQLAVCAGENSAAVRELVCADLEWVGIALDREANGKRAKDAREIQVRLWRRCCLEDTKFDTRLALGVRGLDLLL